MNQIKSFLCKYYYPVCLALIGLLALFLRLYRLNELPYGLHVDEVGLGYNSWCLAHFGTDRYLNELPIYLRNYMSGQSPFYTYFVVLLLRLSGGQLSVSLLRLPAVILNLLAIVCGIKMIRICFQSKKAALTGGLLLAVCPYFIMQGRFALDCNAMFGCSMIAMYLLVKYIHTQKVRDLVFCGIAFGVVMYTYSLSYIVLAIFLPVMSLYLLYTRKITVSRILLLALCIGVTALPIILFALSVLFHWPEFRFLCFTISPVSSNRASELGFQDFWKNIGTVLRSSVTYDHLPYNSVSKQGTLYYISIPFILAGLAASCVKLVSSIRKRCFHPCALFVAFFLAELIVSGLIKNPNINNVNAIFVPLILFLTAGLSIGYGFIRHYRKPFVLAVSAAYFLSIVSFINYYFRFYTDATYPMPYFQASAADAVRYADENLSFSRLYIDYEVLSEYLLFDDPIPPREWLGEDTDPTQAYYIDGYGHYCCVVDRYAAIDPGAVYIVKPQNLAVLEKLETSGLTYQKLVFPSGYILYDFE